MPHETLRKFGYPDSLIHESEHWALMVRPAQVTLGSLVLCARSDVRAYGDLPTEAFADQKRIIVYCESLLRSFSNFDRINYLMLMMVDPQVHFHVFPRYAEARIFAAEAWSDRGWPGPPDLADSRPVPEGLHRDMLRIGTRIAY